MEAVESKKREGSKIITHRMLKRIQDKKEVVEI
jgi:hypothetical protein